MPFLEDGEEVEIIAKFHGGFVVEQLLDDDDGVCPCNGEPFIVTRIFEKPVVPRLEEGILRQKQYLDEVTKSVADARRELHAVQCEIAETRKKRDDIKKEDPKLEALIRVKELLDGTITHVVMSEYYGARIQRIEDVKFHGDYSPKGIKLLTLFGDSQGKLDWKLNTYSDGSQTQSCIPCRSGKEAKTFAEPIFARAVIQNSREPEHVIALAEANGIAVPQKYLDIAKSNREKVAADKVAILKKQLEDAMKETVTA